MLRTRLWMGSVLAALTLGLLLFDDRFAPWYPFLFGFFSLVGHLGLWELRGLFPEERRPPALLSHLGLQAIVSANWLRPVHDALPALVPWHDPWHLVLGLLAAVLLVAFLREMAVFTGPGEAVTRVAMTLFALAYLGVLASFLAQVRWLPGNQAVHGLMLTIFVPKCCDIGAYCTGRLIGRHRMTPILSPKKTWQGAAGGVMLGVVTAVAVSLYGNRPPYYLAKAAAFGVAVAVAGMFGDLAESLIKREGQKKDASQAVPGFGGILDVIDSVLFAAPVSYIWLTAARFTPLG